MSDQHKATYSLCFAEKWVAAWDPIARGNKD